MLSPYMDPEDLVNLVAESISLNEQQLYFHTNYYQGISSIHRKQESCIALAALSALNRNFSQSITELSKLKSSSSTLLTYLHYFLSGLVQEQLNHIELSLSMYNHALLSSYEAKLKKPFLIVIILFNALYETENFQELVNLNIDINCFPDYTKQIVLVRLAYCYEILGNYEKAIEKLKKAQEWQGELADISKIWEKSLMGLECCEDFERFIENEIDQFKSNDWILAYSIYLAKVGNYQKSKGILEAKISTMNRHETFLILGYVYFKLSLYTRSFIYTLKYLKEAPKSANGWFNLAILYQKSQQSYSQKCITKFKKFAKSPQSESLLNNLSDMILINFDISKFGQPAAKVVKIPIQQQSYSNQSFSNSSRLNPEKIDIKSSDDDRSSEINFNYRGQVSKLKTDIIGHEEEVVEDFDSCKKTDIRLKKLSTDQIKSSIRLPNKRRRKGKK